jgi:Tfp pilus assembly protein PilN
VLGVPRTPFVLLVLGLLGGGLVCLLVINTTLSTAQFQINQLQESNATLSQQEQTLQQQIATDESPATIEQRAYKLGLRQEQHLTFLNPRTGRIYREPVLHGVLPVPGFTP